jgi:hypothetical protein
MINFEQKKNLSQIIKTIFNSIYKLIDTEKIEIKNYLMNKNNRKYKYRILIKLVLYLVFIFFTVFDYQYIWLNIWISIIMGLVIICYNVNTYKEVNYYNYSKFRKKVNILKSSLNRLYLIVSNRFLSDQFNEIKQFEEEIQKLSLELMMLNNIFKRKGEIIQNYKVIEIFTILIAIISLIYPFSRLNSDFFTDINFITKTVILLIFAFYFFFLDESIITKGRVSYTHYQRYKEQIDNESIKNIGTNYKFLSKLIEYLIYPDELHSFRDNKISEILNKNSIEN